MEPPRVPGQWPQSGTPGGSLFCRNKHPFPFFCFSKSCSWTECKTSPPLWCCKVWAAEKWAGSIFRGRHLPGPGCQRAAGIFLSPSPLPLSGGGHWASLAPQTAQGITAFPHEWQQEISQLAKMWNLNPGDAQGRSEELLAPRQPRQWKAMELHSFHRIPSMSWTTPGYPWTTSFPVGIHLILLPLLNSPSWLQRITSLSG